MQLSEMSAPIAARDAAEIDRLLVYGETVDDARGRTRARRFPSYRELSHRFAIPESDVRAFARIHDCLRRRECVHGAAIASSIETLLSNRQRPSRADVRALSLLDAALAAMHAAIVAGRYHPNALDIERFWRLENEMSTLKGE